MIAAEDRHDEEEQRTKTCADDRTDGREEHATMMQNHAAHRTKQ